MITEAFFFVAFLICVKAPVKTAQCLLQGKVKKSVKQTQEYYLVITAKK